MKVLLCPITTEKAVKAIETENKMSFVVDRRATKAQVSQTLKEMFKAKVAKINTHIKNNKKIAIVKFKAETPAIDIAIKFGIM